ncbi:MAG: Sir2 family NAD-dependent protein deacetylase, partial [Propionicimonas sp.]|nr:Sir2 family NAD-dependent protein deacetylase [Propionicimonas sp.]
MTSRLREIIESGGRVVFFGGAGVSTESGIPDFRSASGLFHRPSRQRFAPEEILSRGFFHTHPAEFFDYYRTRLVHVDA